MLQNSAHIKHKPEKWRSVKIPFVESVAYVPIQLVVNENMRGGKVEWEVAIEWSKNVLEKVADSFSNPRAIESIIVSLIISSYNVDWFE